jgi:HEAT repeat protein
MLNDRRMLVRKAAAHALESLRDPDAIPELKRHYELARDDDINVQWALVGALRALGAEFEQYPYGGNKFELPDTDEEP